MSDGVYRAAQTPSVTRVAGSESGRCAADFGYALCCHAPPADLSQEMIRNAYTQAGLLAVVTYSFCAEFSRLYSSWRELDPSGGRTPSGAGRSWSSRSLGSASLPRPRSPTAALRCLCGLSSHPSCSVLRASWCGSRLRARDRGYNQRVGAVVGSGPLAQQVSQTLIENPSFGIVSKGHFDDTGRTDRHPR